MNLELITAVTEILSALAVLISLVYLAVQIKQNTKAMKANTEQGISDSTSSGIIGVSHTNIPYLVVKAGNDPSSLSDEELSQYAFWINGSLRHWEHAYFQYKSGNFSEESWSGLYQQIAMHMGSVGVRNYWNLRKSTYREDFREIVDAAATEVGPLSSPEALSKMRDSDGVSEDT
ncbi:MAG: hypothetical protein AB8B81_09895 [Halioglobus sp.]